MMGLSDLMSNMSDGSSDMGANVEIQTQASILQSDTLALRTIETLHLEDTEDFTSSAAAAVDHGPADACIRRGPAGAPLQSAPRRRQRLLKIFSKRLTVKPNAGTRLIEVDYLNPDPQAFGGGGEYTDEVADGL